MIDLPFWSIAALLAAAAPLSLLVLMCFGALTNRRAMHPDHPAKPDTSASFLFRDSFLLHSSLSDTASFQAGFEFGEASGWNELRLWLSPRFEGLPKALDEIANAPVTFCAVSPDDSAKLEIVPQENSTRVTLSESDTRCVSERHELLKLRLAHSDLEDVLARAPFPIWKTDSDGALLWQNSACQEKIGNPLSAFDASAVTADTPAPHRITITRDDGATTCCYEVETIPDDKGVTHYATDATRLVHAEIAQKEFVQTLTKTFANLTTGLVVFDKHRQLALFNPALIEHTSLPADFLSSRPSLMSFFDSLRNRRVMPEPKNYANWRAQINDVVETASGGLYQETWALPDGATIRVSGRPHPDGAVAFLFEDITDEVSLTRRFRAQLDIRQSVLDRLGNAIAVFSSRNVLLFCNRPCMSLLNIDPDSAFTEMSTNDLISICEQRLPDTDFWPEVRDLMNRRALEVPLQKIVTLPGGVRMDCSFAPLPGGNTLFSARKQAAATPQVKTEPIAD